VANIADFVLGNLIAVNVTDEAFQVEGRPPSGGDKQTGASKIRANVSFNTIWKAHVGMFHWETGETSVEISWSNEPTPPPFHHAVDRGRLTMKEVDSRYVFPVRALRLSGKPWPTLAGVAWTEIDGLVGGSAQELFHSLGDIEFGLYGDFVSNAGVHKNAIGASASQEAAAAIVAVFVTTRALAVLKNLGS
jgi:hypothetical protein